MFKNNSSYLVLYTENIKKTHDFYESIGAEIKQLADDKVVVQLGGFDFHFILGSTEPIEACNYIVNTQPRGGSLMFYVEVENIEDALKKVREAEGKIIFEIEERPWQQKEFLFEDPNGYRVLCYVES